MVSNSRAMVRRLRAWHLGEPITRGTTIHHAMAEPKHRLVVAFVKMGGETRPWGIAWKEGTKKTKVLTVPEPRLRAAGDEIAAQFAPVLVRHLWHPAFGHEAKDATGLEPLHQIWLPNASHLAMLHHFAYAYSRRPLDLPDSEVLRLLGRASLAAFLEAQRPGQQLVMLGTDALRSAYDFPAEDVRQGHLGFLLAWLGHRGDRAAGLAAAIDAEQQSIATALDPELERARGNGRTGLGDLVTKYNEARRDGHKAAMRTLEHEIAGILEPELERRIGVTLEAIEVIEADPRPVNPGVERLVRATSKSFFFRWYVPEERAFASGLEPFVTSPETDVDTRNAAEAYYRAQAADDMLFNALVHHDRELEAEAISDGRAFRGTIVAVTDEGTGRKTIPVWQLHDPTPGPLSIRPGDEVCVVGFEKRKGRVRKVEATDSNGLELEFEITGSKTAGQADTWPFSMHGSDERWIGQIITLIGTSFAEMTEKKAVKVRSRDPQPGDWILSRPDAESKATTDTDADVDMPADEVIA